MGACYDVTLKIRLKKDSEKKAADALRNHMLHDEGTNYNFEKFESEGTTTKTLDELIRICLAGWKSCPFRKEQEGEWTVYDNGFDASYGWESVMTEMFEILTPYLEDESEISIYPDNYTTHLYIKDQKCVWE